MAQVLRQIWPRKLAQYDWLLLVLLAPIFLYADRVPPSIVCLALLALPLSWLSHFLSAGRFITRTPLDLPILCLLLTVPLSLYASASFATSLPRLTGLLFGIALYYSLLRLSADAQRFPVAVGFWLLSAFSIAVLGLFGTDWVTSKFSVLNGLTNLLPHLVSGLGSRSERGLHPNVIGGTLALFITPLLSALWVRRARKAEAQPMSERRGRWRAWLYPDQPTGRMVWLAALLVLGGLLLLTQSRSALFGVAVALVFYGAVRSKALRWLAVLGMAASLVALIAIGPNRVGEALLGTGGVSAVGSLDFPGRQEVWSRALYALQDFPFTGVGLGQFEAVVRLFYPLFLIGPDTEVPHAHNIYLQVGVDFGIGGLVAYVAMLVAVLLMAVRAYRSLPPSLPRRLLLGFACGLLAFQLFGLSDAVAVGTKPAFEWWLTLSLIGGLYLQARCQSHPQWRAVKWRVSPLEVLSLWLLVSLVAIAMVGSNALLGVGLAILGGCALGIVAFFNFE